MLSKEEGPVMRLERKREFYLGKALRSVYKPWWGTSLGSYIGNSFILRSVKSALAAVGEPTGGSKSGWEGTSQALQ